MEKFDSKFVSIRFNFLRHFSVISVTVYLTLILVSLFQATGGLYWFLIVIAIFGFFISIPIVVFWVYSFVLSLKALLSAKSLNRKDLIYFYIQIFDLCLTVAVIVLGLCTEFKTEADLMQDHYEMKWHEMRSVVNDTRKLLPDSVSFGVEFNDTGYWPGTGVLTASQLNNLKIRLRDVGCIGIDIDIKEN